MSEAHDALSRVLHEIGDCAVALSGGVDSVTLAAVAHGILGRRVEMIHAVSPAVPPAATRRVRELARDREWRLTVLDAGEFADPRYRANPANRCFFCKTNLYGTMAGATDVVLLSGTNLDDLGDWRPGLQAARDHGVRHPYVEAGIDKAGVRALARELGLPDIAELPSAPCLSSRVETGLRIEPDMLRAIDAVETDLRDALGPRTVRVRLRAEQVGVELDDATLARLEDADRRVWASRIADRFGAALGGRPVVFDAYRRGSAFLRGTS